jgi:hypothetical protein
MDFASVDYTPVSPYTPLAILLVLIVGVAFVVLADRMSNPRLTGRDGLSETTQTTRTPAPSILARMAEREWIGQLSAAHLIRRRFLIG